MVWSLWTSQAQWVGVTRRQISGWRKSLEAFKERLMGFVAARFNVR